MLGMDTESVLRIITLCPTVEVLAIRDVGFWFEVSVGELPPDEIADESGREPFDTLIPCPVVEISVISDDDAWSKLDRLPSEAVIDVGIAEEFDAKVFCPVVGGCTIGDERLCLEVGGLLPEVRVEIGTFAGLDAMLTCCELEILALVDINV